MRRTLFSFLAVIVTTVTLVLPARAEAATCGADNCQLATISAILLDWPVGSPSVKVRFVDTLSGLSCNFNGGFREIQLSTKDLLFKEKLSLLMSAYLAGKQVWFYATNNTDPTKGQVNQCMMTMLTFQP